MGLRGNYIGNLAYFNHMKGDLKKAEKQYLRAIKLGLDNPKRLTSYAVMIMRKGDFEGAIKMFAQVIAMRPKIDIRTKARINRAISFIKVGRYDEAKVALEDIHNNYRSKRVYETLGYLYTVIDDKKCLEYNLEGLDYDPGNFVILDNLVQFYINRKDYANARKYAETAFEADPKKVDILYHMALIEHHDKNIEKAKEHANDMMEARLTALNDVTQKQLDALYKKIMGKAWVKEDQTIA